MQKRLLITLVGILISLSVGVTPTLTHAETVSVLPYSEDAANLTDMECLSVLNTMFGQHSTEEIVAAMGRGEGIEIRDEESGLTLTPDTILACGIKSGKIKYWMVGFIIKNLLDFLIRVGALLAVLMVILGRYYYMTGSLEDDKEKGKNTIKYALMGLVVALGAWPVANLILLLVTQ